jgi:hypothetical protein
MGGLKGSTSYVYLSGKGIVFVTEGLYLSLADQGDQQGQQGQDTFH